MNMYALARQPARILRHMPDRVVHTVRRRRVRREVAADSAIDSVVFVCLGNICRSPYAAAAFQRALPNPLRDHIRVRSAGLIGPNRPAPEEAVIAGRARGLDLSAHRSELITQDHVGPTDLIVVMETAQRTAIRERFWVRGRVVVLGDFDPAPITTRAILDPYGKPAATFAECYQRIDRCIDGLLSALEFPAVRSGPAS